VLQDGQGTRADPYRYCLPGMAEKWQADFLESFMKRLETDAKPGGSEPRVAPPGTAVARNRFRDPSPAGRRKRCTATPSASRLRADRS
jgi:hypothetical protein